MTVREYRKLIKNFNKLEWHYKDLPTKNCKIKIKFYEGNYDLANFYNGTFKIGKRIIKFKRDFKKWSY